LEENDLHVRLSLLVQIGVGQQGQEARALDGGRQLALIAGLGAGDARRHDLAGLGDEVLQQIDILVVDLFDLLGREAAELATLEQTAAAAVILFLELGLRLESHFSFLPEIRSFPGEASDSGCAGCAPRGIRSPALTSRGLLPPASLPAHRSPPPATPS